MKLNRDKNRFTCLAIVLPSRPRCATVTVLHAPFILPSCKVRYNLFRDLLLNPLVSLQPKIESTASP